MPVRRRQAKRKRAVDADLFLNGDGVEPFFTGDDVFENAFLARAAWQTVRAATWGIPYRGIWPPHAAFVYDGFTELTHKQHPTSRGVAWNIEDMREAVEADIASVEAFRKADPEAAEEIVDELDGFIADLGVLLALAEKSKPSELGYHTHLVHLWGDYEIRRSGR
jgi:hypothetical protein